MLSLSMTQEDCYEASVDKTLAQYLGLYLCRCLTVFISPQGPVSNRGLGLGQAEGTARGLMGSWYSAGRHSWSECVPAPCVMHWSNLKQRKRKQSQSPRA